MYIGATRIRGGVVVGYGLGIEREKSRDTEYDVAKELEGLERSGVTISHG